MDDTLILKIVKGPMKGLTIPLGDGQKVAFGRSPKCGKGTLAADAAMGWRQFVIEVRLPQATLRSLGTTNPTYVNGSPCEREIRGLHQEVVLRHGDRIQAGRTVFEVMFATLDQHDRVERQRSPGAPTVGTGNEGKIVVLRPDPVPSPSPQPGGLQIEVAEGPPVVSGFTIGRLLKRGSLGGTYAARRNSDGAPVIIKVARFARALTPFQIDEMRHGLLGLAGLRHPHILSLLDFGLSNDTHAAVAALCLEYCDGECLGDTVNQTAGRAAPHFIYDTFHDLLGALQSAHARGVHHCNLKPQNIFLARGIERSRALLADFAIPILFRLQQDGRPESMSWLDRDAAAFVPPPHLEAVMTTTPAGDLWSLAAIGYYLLHGCAPDKEKPTELLRTAKDGRPRCGKRDRGVEQPLQQLIGDGLSGQFATAAEMAAALAALKRPQVIRRRDFGVK